MQEPKVGVEIKVCWIKLHTRPVGLRLWIFCAGREGPAVM